MRLGRCYEEIEYMGGRVIQQWRGWSGNVRLPHLLVSFISIIIINLLAQKHDKVTCATKQIERDSKDTDATDSCPGKVQIKLVRNTLQK